MRVFAAELEQQFNLLPQNLSKLETVGYKNVWKFYKGESMYNASITGWRGHTENGSKYDAVEGFF